MAFERFVAELGVEQPAFLENCRVPRLRGIFAAMAVQPRFKPIRLYCLDAAEGRTDTLEVEVQCSIPQVRVNDIRPTERLLIHCAEPETGFPIVWPLRESFPLTSHQNAPYLGLPKSLCLYIEKFDEMVLVWNPTEFLSRVVRWLEETATGTLHPDDQPIEPFFYAASKTLVLPRGFDLYAVDNQHTWLTGGIISPLGDEAFDRALITLQVVPTGHAAGRPRPFVSVLAMRTQPMEHGVMKVMPRTLGELTDTVTALGGDLVARIRDHIIACRGSAAWNPNGVLLILIQVPLQRDGHVARTHSAAFLCTGDLKDMGLAVDVLSDATVSPNPADRYPVWHPLAGTRQNRSVAIAVEGVNVIDDLCREYAIAASSSPTQLLEIKIGFMGQGALGSPIYNNLVRSGAEITFVVDDDTLLPHNLVRHLLQRGYIGLNKAHGVAHYHQEFWGKAPLVISSDIKEALSVPAQREVIEAANIIVDCGASQAASRTLALDFKGNGRRIVCFASPTGQDGVCLAEDAAREFTVDSVEAQYFRYLIRNPLGDTHLAGIPEMYRYGIGCRDRSAVMSPERMAMHASLLTGEIKDVITSDYARAIVWAHTGTAVNRVDIPLAPPRRQQLRTLTVVWDEEVEATMHRLRAEKLPEETGGPLVGYMDVLRQIVYIVDALPAPPDSKAGRGHFVRGSAQLDASLAEIVRRTGKTVTLVGDWHSHPMGHSADPSTDDLMLLAIEGLEMATDQRPGLIAIAGEGGDTQFFLGTVIDPLDDSGEAEEG